MEQGHRTGQSSQYAFNTSWPQVPKAFVSGDLLLPFRYIFSATGRARRSKLYSYLRLFVQVLPLIRIHVKYLYA